MTSDDIIKEVLAQIAGEMERRGKSYIHAKKCTKAAIAFATLLLAGQNPDGWSPSFYFYEVLTHADRMDLVDLGDALIMQLYLIDSEGGDY